MAFDQFKKSCQKPFKLLIVGEKSFMASDIEKAHRNMIHARDVIFHDRLPPDKLQKVIGASAGLTFVPLFEGFGIPLLEAMQCEIPILASNSSSLPEIAGEAALYVDPMNVLSIAEGMNSLATDDSLRKELIAAGRIRKSSFSWESTASKLWSSISRTLLKKSK